MWSELAAELADDDVHHFWIRRLRMIRPRLAKSALAFDDIMQGVLVCLIPLEEDQHEAGLETCQLELSLQAEKYRSVVLMLQEGRKPISAAPGRGPVVLRHFRDRADLDVILQCETNVFGRSNKGARDGAHGDTLKGETVGNCGIGLLERGELTLHFLGPWLRPAHYAEIKGPILRRCQAGPGADPQ